MVSAIPDIGQFLIQFLISVGFAFLIGMEVYSKTPEENRKYLFGSERTFALIALLGFILLKSGDHSPGIYIAGFIVVSIFLLVYYFRKIINTENRGITTITLGMLVYVFPLAIEQFPLWCSLLMATLIMVLVEVKSQVKEFSKKIYTDEFLTLAKFVFLSGVILPLVPDKEIIPGIPVSPYKLWLAIVVISAISYMSYLLRKYVFPKAGLMLTAILGGLYSSTATTFIIAKKSKDGADAPSHYAAAILVATVLMFLRVFILVAIFNPVLSIHMLPWFLILFVTSGLVTFFIYRIAPQQDYTPPAEDVKSNNPLELRVALIFGVLYIVFSLLTQYTMQYYGHSGLNVLSFIVGFTDIDPFLLNMFQGKYAGITVSIISAATLQAIASNNILKMVYALFLGDKAIRKYILTGFAIIITTNILMLFFL
jgi:uncharacterized membrane protein (DUF4010 family)